MPVISLEVPYQLADKLTSLAGHHEANREAHGVGGGCDELEAAERAECSVALKIHV